MEELAPICIRRVRIKTALGDILRENVRYYNIVVKNCPPYVPNPAVKDGYIRASPIQRLKAKGAIIQPVEWPDHPKDVFGDHVGAIVILNSLDNKILILRNDHLWGLPKGVRNFTEFHKIKTEFTAVFESTGESKVFEEPVVFEQVETGVENICRETLEETGIVLNPYNLILYGGEDRSAYTKYYYQLDFVAADYLDILLKNGTDHENDELKWIDYKELNQMLQQHRQNRQAKVFNHVTYTFLSAVNGRPAGV
jgi:8-oxo-dGTP pyrophosphatase MutT (NUDIX family)